ncbi:hypothetical protein DFH09DRAFT_1093916 [Mycena vulgaris]|nr:hypothetical protein DFH09DRAFT_1093916 [Mycena vulgaris]
MTSPPPTVLVVLASAGDTALRPTGTLTCRSVSAAAPGRTLHQVYSRLKQALETRVNRAAHVLGVGLLAVVARIDILFGLGEQRTLLLNDRRLHKKLRDAGHFKRLEEAAERGTSRWTRQVASTSGETRGVPRDRRDNAAQIGVARGRPMRMRPNLARELIVPLAFTAACRKFTPYKAAAFAEPSWTSNSRLPESGLGVGCQLHLVARGWPMTSHEKEGTSKLCRGCK